MHINHALHADTSGYSSWLQAASVPTGTAGLKQHRCRSNNATLRQCRISTRNTCNLDWPSAKPDRFSTSQPQTTTMGVYKQLSWANFSHGVPLINSPGPVPYGEQAQNFSALHSQQASPYLYYMGCAIHTATSLEITRPLASAKFTISAEIHYLQTWELRRSKLQAITGSLLIKTNSTEILT